MSECRLYCTEVRTVDWIRLVTWYRDVVGLRVAVRMTGRRYALLAGSEGRLAILGRDETEDDGRRFSLVFEVPDLDAVRERLRANNVTILDSDPPHENYRELLVDDPDGNRVRFFAWPE